jgi:hypothetical protein
MYLLALICLSKGMCLSLVGNKVVGLTLELDELVKNFSLHFGGFLLLDNEPSLVLVVTIWRSLSIANHAVPAFEKHVSEKVYKNMISVSKHLNSAALSIVLLMSIFSPTIRSGFASSALGHISCMAFHISAIFRMGFGHLSTEEERDEWNDMSLQKKVHLLFISTKHFWLAIEVGLNITTIMYFLILRVF